MIEIFNRKIGERLRLFRDFQDRCHCQPVIEAAARMSGSIAGGNKVLVFGNGGSATQSSHFAAELVNKFYFDRNPLPAISLAADIAFLTCISNDSDYKFVFSRQVEALGKSGDVALGITTSGRSPNVLTALSKAKEMGLTTVVLCGSNTDPLLPLGVDVTITVPSTDTPSIQEVHLFILHMMAEMLEAHFFKSAEIFKGVK